MKATNRILSTYTADISGVCSALYELGGLTVMHDASGCNSTYNTHDEPRWYDMDSMVYISGLAEYDAVMGNDDKLVADIVAAARELKPRFIAVAGTPIPMMMGTDFAAVAKLIEGETGLPTLGLDTNSMHSYQVGISKALVAVAERFCPSAVSVNSTANEEKAAVNLLGVTPLDFSVTGTVEALKTLLTAQGHRVVGCWAMGSSLDELAMAGQAQVNIVATYSGLATAQLLQEKYGTPYVVGLPVGLELTERFFTCLEQAANTGQNQIIYRIESQTSKERPTVVVGEAVSASSLRYALLAAGLKDVRVLCPLEASAELLAPGDWRYESEDEIASVLEQAGAIIADPLYQLVLDNWQGHFVPLPHEAYSGRIYRQDIPVLLADEFDGWYKNNFNLGEGFKR